MKPPGLPDADDWGDVLDDFGAEQWTQIIDDLDDRDDPISIDDDLPQPELDALDFDLPDHARYVAAQKRKEAIVHWLHGSRFVLRSGTRTPRSCYACASNNVRWNDRLWQCQDCGSRWQAATSAPDWHHFLVRGGVTVRLQSGRSVDLLDWLLAEGLVAGTTVSGWRIVHFERTTSTPHTLVFCRIDGNAEDDERLVTGA